MAEAPRLPASFVAVPTLEICGNTFVNVPTPIAIGQYPVLLIGEGELPVVWLAAPKHPKSKKWAFVVEKNRSLNAGLLVKRRTDDHEVVVSAGSTTLLRVEAVSPTHARILEIDLRPLGLNVVGKALSLRIAGSSFTNNRIENSSVGFAFG